MAEGLKTPPITQLEFDGKDDFKNAEKIARRLGYKQTAYTSTSGLWGLFCLNENPAHSPGARHHLPPFTAGCIIKTKEFGFLFLQDVEDLHMEDIPR